MPLTWVREGECIRCTSHNLDNRGYPLMWRNGKPRRVARMILMLRVGDIPPAVVCRHTCDNKWCIRPDHIIGGTQAQNIADRIERGRGARGERVGCAKLTSLQVLEIRKVTGLQKDIAERFGIDPSEVSRIRNRQIWRHV